MKLLCFLIFAFSADLICYDCEPWASGKCLDPVGDNSKMTRCKETGSKKLPKSLISEVDYECFAINYTPRNRPDQKGIYRGCIEKSDNTCDHLKKMLSGGEVKSCNSCSENLCNREVYVFQNL